MLAMEPAMPLIHSALFHTNGSIRMCGSGSQTVPNWKNDDSHERLSSTRRAMLMCATASP